MEQYTYKHSTGSRRGVRGSVTAETEDISRVRMREQLVNTRNISYGMTNALNSFIFLGKCRQSFSISLSLLSLALASSLPLDISTSHCLPQFAFIHVLFTFIFVQRVFENRREVVEVALLKEKVRFQLYCTNMQISLYKISVMLARTLV